MDNPRNNFEIAEKKIDNESNIGILATLITGFSISLLPTISLRDLETCSCPIWSESVNYYVQHVLMWLSTILLTIVSIISGITVVYFSSYKWHGMKIITRREDTVEEEKNITIYTYRKQLLNAFNSWWNSEQNNRKLYRRLFSIIIPIFLFSLSLSPSIWCNNCILGLIVNILFLLSSIPLCSIIKRLILNKIKIE
jgi:hypothetical protein